jgi:hypothetical protein
MKYEDHLEELKKHFEGLPRKKTKGCCEYTDGTPSREIEEDWEETGQDEMNEIYDSCKEKKFDRPTATRIRDRINHTFSLVEICCIALTHPQWKNQPFVQKHVANVLCDYVCPELETMEQELKLGCMI